MLLTTKNDNTATLESTAVDKLIAFERAIKEAKAKENARKRAIKSVGSSAAGTVGRELGKNVGSSFGKFGKTLGGNVGASLGRGVLSTLFKL